MRRGERGLGAAAVGAVKMIQRVRVVGGLEMLVVVTEVVVEGVGVEAGVLTEQVRTAAVTSFLALQQPLKSSTCSPQKRRMA